MDQAVKNTPNIVHVLRENKLTHLEKRMRALSAGGAQGCDRTERTPEMDI